jgi:hypothetical protein
VLIPRNFPVSDDQGPPRVVNNIDREERRAHLEQRRAAVAHQLRRLAIELTDLDRQLDDIEQSDGRGMRAPGPHK